MNLIATHTRIPAEHTKVLDAITTTAGHRGWWTDDCDVGVAVGQQAVYRFDTAEVTFRIDRIGARGIEMTCVRSESFPDWEDTHLTLRAVEDGAGTYVDFLHDGWAEKSAFYGKCVEQWDHYAQSLRAYCETDRGAPYVSKKPMHARPSQATSP